MTASAPTAARPNTAVRTDPPRQETSEDGAPDEPPDSSGDHQAKGSRGS